MEDDVEGLRLATTELLRILKVMEPAIPNMHSRFREHPTDIATLRFIADNPGAPAKALAAYLGAAPTTATSVVDRLVRIGLVERSRADSDRRAIELKLTADGAEAYAQIIEEERDNMRRMLAALPERNRAAFVRYMTQIAERLSAEADDAARDA
ncbi:MAG: MarR family transcriptional regulator [Pseudomonadota bacterium]